VVVDVGAATVVAGFVLGGVDGVVAVDFVGEIRVDASSYELWREIATAPPTTSAIASAIPAVTRLGCTRRVLPLAAGLTCRPRAAMLRDHRTRSAAMDVRSIVDVEPEVEHNGTVPVWYLVHPREMKAITEGGSLELVNEFEVANGGYVYPHSHPTHEFYFVMSGRGVMTIDGEDRDVAPGDLVYIPPDLIHSLRPTGGGAIHCFCFAVAVKDAPEIDYPSH
jgi:mannose-6-phosphate isomerase-like protein (cupin superfamily)